MKLHDPAFAAALKAGVRRAVRKNAALRREKKRQPRPSRRSAPWLAWLRRTPFIFIYSVAMIVPLQRGAPAEVVMFFFTLWTTYIALPLAQQFAAIQQPTHDVAALWHQPVDEDTIFRYRRDQLMKAHLSALLDFAVGLFVLGLVLHVSALGWLWLVLLVLPCWGYSATLAAFLAARLPRLPFGMMTATGYVISLGCIFVGRRITPEFWYSVQSSLLAIDLTLPTGWALQMTRLVLLDGPWWSLLYALPVALAALTWRDSMAVLASRLHYQEPCTIPAAEIVPDDDAPTIGRGGEEIRQSIGVTAIAEGVLSGGFMTRPAWKANAFTRLVWRWFTERERNLADFAFVRQPALLRAWRGILLSAITAAIACGMTKLLAAPWFPLVSGISLALVYLQVLAVTWASGRFFQPMRNFGVQIPAFAAFPITFREIAGLVGKISLVQMPAVLLLNVAVAGIFIWTANSPVEGALLFALKGTLLYYSSGLGWLVLRLSGTTNDTTHSFLRAMRTLMFFGTSLGIYLGLTAIAIFVPSQLASWILCAATCAFSYGFFRFYAWRYDSGKIDPIATVT